VIPQEYHEFFAATAGATGALIGLLFVAVSVHPGQARQAQTRVTFHNRASAALLVFTNALVLSLAALVPGTTLGWWAIVMSASVLIFAAATIRSIVANARHPSRRQGSLGVVIALLIIAGFELYAGIRLVVDTDFAAVSTLSYVIIGDLGVGISRAWQLVGLRDTGLLTSLRILAGIAQPVTATTQCNRPRTTTGGGPVTVPAPHPRLPATLNTPSGELTVRQVLINTRSYYHSPTEFK
jgi:hypothetical protein